MLVKRALLVAILMLSSTLSASLFLPQASAGGFDAEDVVDLAQQDRAIKDARSLASIALSHPAFRVAGSSGANESADMILNELKSMGLDAWKEEFNFTTWDLSSPATLTVDADGDANTSNDITVFNSFLAEGWSKPLSNESYELEAIYFPQFGNRADWEWLTRIPIGYWNELNLTNKIVIVPREIKWNQAFERRLANKIAVEPPAGVIFAYGFEFDSSAVDMSQVSTGGKPMSEIGDYLFANNVAAGSVNYSEGTELFAIEARGNATAKMSVQSTIAQGKMANIVAVLPGTTEKEVLVTAHYDSVMSAGYLDNAGGVAAMLETARCAVQAKSEGWQPACTLRFIAFTGEELYLLGSGMYVSQHRAELAKVKAVINIDCIGGEQMLVSMPMQGAVLQLDRIVSHEASRLGVGISTYEGEGGSDHYAFQRPLETIYALEGIWHIEMPGKNLTLLPDSVMLSSEPLTVFEGSDGKVGLIHTSYDRPDSQFSYWMNDSKFFEQTKVAISSVAVLAEDVEGPVIPEGMDPVPIVAIGFGIVGIIVLVSYASVRKRKKNG